MEYSWILCFKTVQVNQISSVIPGVPGVLGCFHLPQHVPPKSFVLHQLHPQLSSLQGFHLWESWDHRTDFRISGLWMAMALTCNIYVYTVYIYVHINYEIVTSIPFGHVPSTSSFGCKFLLLTQPLRFPNHFLSSKKNSRAKCQECRPGECHWYLQIWVADKINCSPKFPKVRLGRPLSVVKLFVFFKTSSRQKK